jgi:hypothetical protein
MSPTKHMLRPPLIEPPEVKEITLQEWNQQLKESGPLLPGPTIAQAQTAQYRSLVAECTHCNRIAHVPFESIRRPPATPIADLLQALICTRCGQKGPPTAKIRGVATHTDDPVPAFQMPLPDEE